MPYAAKSLRPYVRQNISSTKRGYGYLHQKIRRLVLQRDPVCMICGLAPSTVCDHIVPLRLGGETSLENCRGACWACNDKRAEKRRY